MTAATSSPGTRRGASGSCRARRPRDGEDGVRDTTAGTAAAAATTCRLTQRVRYHYTAPIHDLRQRLLLVPPAVHGHQRRHAWSLAVGGASASSTRARRDSFGNLALELRVPRVDEWVEFVVTTEVTRRSWSSVHRIRPDRRYLEPTRLTAPDVALQGLASP